MNELRSEPPAPAPAMKSDAMATIMPLLIITLLTIHLSEDVVYGYEPAGLVNLVGVPVAALWLYATLALAGRRAGYILLLLGSFFATVIPIIHMSGRGVREEVVRSGGGLLFIWIMIALAMSASVAGFLSIHGLWRVKKSVLGFLVWTLVTVGAGGALLGFLVFGRR